jgi:hypothetical protein
MNWEKFDAWRRDPLLKTTKLRHIFPGFGTAAVAFTLFVIGGKFWIM